MWLINMSVASPSPDDGGGQQSAYFVRGRLVGQSLRFARTSDFSASNGVFACLGLPPVQRLARTGSYTTWYSCSRVVGFFPRRKIPLSLSLHCRILASMWIPSRRSHGPIILDGTRKVNRSLPAACPTSRIEIFYCIHPKRPRGVGFGSEKSRHLSPSSLNNGRCRRTVRRGGPSVKSPSSSSSEPWETKIL